MLGKKLSYFLKHSKFNWIGKPFYELLIKVELAFIVFRNNKYMEGETTLVDSELTAIIKTFERPKTLYRLLNSLKKYYPNMRVIVIDDSKEPIPIIMNNVEHVIMPYDSGVSIGRKKGLELVETKYTLLLDDDFIFYDKTRLEPILSSLQYEKKIDIVGGEVINLPSFKAFDYKKGRLFRTTKESIYPVGTMLGKFEVYDKVANFYIARTQRLKLISWDENIKRLDHADFFTRAKGVLVTTFSKEFKILHAQTPHNKKYMKKRNDIKQDRLILHAKYFNKTSMFDKK